jgi:hypothetical protein
MIALDGCSVGGRRERERRRSRPGPLPTRIGTRFGRRETTGLFFWWQHRLLLLLLTSRTALPPLASPSCPSLSSSRPSSDHPAISSSASTNKAGGSREKRGGVEGRRGSRVLLHRQSRAAQRRIEWIRRAMEGVEVGRRRGTRFRLFHAYWTVVRQLRGGNEAY